MGGSENRGETTGSVWEGTHSLAEGMGARGPGVWPRRRRERRMKGLGANGKPWGRWLCGGPDCVSTKTWNLLSQQKKKRPRQCIYYKLIEPRWLLFLGGVKTIPSEGIQYVFLCIFSSFTRVWVVKGRLQRTVHLAGENWGTSFPWDQLAGCNEDTEFTVGGSPPFGKKYHVMWTERWTETIGLMASAGLRLPHGS